MPRIDCTDFTAYVYSLGLGIQMHSGTPSQIEFMGSPAPAPGAAARGTVIGFAGDLITQQFFSGPHFGVAALNSLDPLIAQFQAGSSSPWGIPLAIGVAGLAERPRRGRRTGDEDGVGSGGRRGDFGY